MDQDAAMRIDLSPRESEIEQLLIRGYSQVNISAVLGISENTAGVHTRHIYAKRGVHTQIDLLLAFLERNNIWKFKGEPHVSTAD